MLLGRSALGLTDIEVLPNYSRFLSNYHDFERRYADYEAAIATMQSDKTAEMECLSTVKTACKSVRSSPVGQKSLERLLPRCMIGVWLRQI